MKKRRFRAAALLAAVMICLIRTVPVHAANTKEEYDDYQYDFLLETQLQYQKYRVVVDGTTDYKIFRVIQTGNNTDVIYYVSSNDFVINTRYFLHGKDRDNYYYLMPWTKKTAESHIVRDQSGNDVTFYMSAAIIYSHDDDISGIFEGTLDLNDLPDDYDYNQALYDVFTGKKDVPGYTKEKPAFPTDDNSTYNADLGFLQNVTYKVGAVASKEEVRVQQYANFNWSTTTSTGIDLTDPDVDVQFMIKVQGYGTSWKGEKYNLATKSSDYMLLSDYSDNDYSLSMAFTGEDDGTFLGKQNPYSMLLAEVGASGPVSRSMTLVSTFYFRPVTYDDGWQYGGWTRVTTNYNEGDPTLNYDYEVTEGITENGTPIIKDNLTGEDDGLIPDNSHSGSGTVGNGNTLDEALNNATSGDPGLSGDLISNVNSMLSMITEVPAILGTLFSFLPGWCLTLFAVGFGLIIVLIVYKLVRG